MTFSPCRRFIGLLTLLLWLGTCVPALAHHTAPHEIPLLRQVDFVQRLHEFIPLDLVLWDETGRPVPLHDYFGGKPVILSLVYYNCPNLCTMVLNGLLRTLRALSLTVGADFDVLVVSINPHDTPALAAAKKTQYVRGYGRAGAANGWHFLTGPSEVIQRLTQAVGFHYTYDAARDQFAHASGIMVLTPQGQL